MRTRHTHIDLAKVIASQLIVMHHFASYGPLADAIGLAVPRLSAWLYDYARMAVQVFLVLGGFLAAKGWEHKTISARRHPLLMVWQRYWRLTLPFIVALVFTMACSAVVALWFTAEFIPHTPTPGQILAHATLLHGVLGVESLSVGVWYVAIDFQLFVLMTLLMWLGARWARLLVGGLMLAALFVFNLHEDWDNWAVYFFGAYGLGAMALWAGHARHAGRYLCLLALLGVAVLAWDFRERMALAFAVALMLGVVQWKWHPSARLNASVAPHRVAHRFPHVVAELGKSSYALFLVHFPVVMVANAVLAHGGRGAASKATIAITLLVSWLACMALAWTFERWVERPLYQWTAPKR